MDKIDQIRNWGNDTLIKMPLMRLFIDFLLGGRVDMNFAVILRETKSQIHCFRTTQKPKFKIVCHEESIVFFNRHFIFCYWN